MKERDHCEDVGAEVNIIVKQILRKWDRSVYITFIWLRIRTGGGLL
jgi:hypothetical protein